MRIRHVYVMSLCYFICKNRGLSHFLDTNWCLFSRLQFAIFPKLSPFAFTTELQMAFLSRIFRGWSFVLREITCSFCSVLTDHKFASAGREDIDVRMLGNGKSQSLPLSLGQLQERGLWPDPNWKSATHVLRSFQLKTDGLTILNDYSTHAQKSGLARCWPENNWSQGTVHYRCVSITMRGWEQSEQTKGGKNTYPTPLRSCSFNPAPQLAFFFFFFFIFLRSGPSIERKEKLLEQSMLP